MIGEYLQSSEWEESTCECEQSNLFEEFIGTAPPIREGAAQLLTKACSLTEMLLSRLVGNFICNFFYVLFVVIYLSCLSVKQQEIKFLIHIEKY